MWFELIFGVVCVCIIYFVNKCAVYEMILPKVIAYDTLYSRHPRLVNARRDAYVLLPAENST